MDVFNNPYWKGVETLLEGWRHLGDSVPLKLVADGPMAATVREAAAKDAAIRWLGNMPLDAIYGVLGAAKLLVLPSQCYETFARVAIEAFAKGTPVIGSRLGAMVEVVDEDAIDLAEKVRRVLADPLELARMRQAARQKFDRTSLLTSTTRVLWRSMSGSSVIAPDQLRS